MGCNCSKKMKIRQLVKTGMKSKSADNSSDSKLSIIKKIWEDAKNKEDGEIIKNP